MAALATLPMCVVDAFASRAFSGNPAAVVDFGDAAFLPDAVLQAIARENNLAETAFVRRSSGAACDRIHATKEVKGSEPGGPTHSLIKHKQNLVDI